jgi:hypothetical protein
VIYKVGADATATHHGSGALTVVLTLTNAAPRGVAMIDLIPFD